MRSVRFRLHFLIGKRSMNKLTIKACPVCGGTHLERTLDTSRQTKNLNKLLIRILLHLQVEFSLFYLKLIIMKYILMNLTVICQLAFYP